MTGRTGWLLASLAFTALNAFFFLAQLAIFPLWGPYSTFDEQLQNYQAGRNFAEYGFFRTVGLPDLSTSSDPSLHPLVYNHQPPGPQILMGVLIRAFGEQYRAIRAFFALLFLAGIAAYVRFLRILDLGQLPGAATALLLVSPQTQLHMIDHPVYSSFPLFAFLPWVALHRAASGGSQWWRALALLLVFVGTNYLIYGPLLMIFTFWLLAGLTGALPMARRDLWAIALAALGAFLLHLLQTLVMIGPGPMIQETIFVISNRMTGRPTREELAAFYNSLGLLLYGGHQFSITRLLVALARSLTFSGTVVLAVVVASAILARRGRNAAPGAYSTPLESRTTLALTASAVVAVVFPTLAFPAFATDYGLQGMGEFILAVAAVSCLVPSRKLMASFSTPRRNLFQMLLGAGLVVVVSAQLVNTARVARRTVVWAGQPATELGLQWVAEHLRGKPVMTNIDPIPLGFLTREVAVGGCHRAAVFPEPDHMKCFVRLGRDTSAPTLSDVHLYVWVGVGNQFCPLPVCITRSELDAAYPALFSNDLVSVFDLSRIKGTPR